MREGWESTSLGEVCEFVRGPFGGSLTKSCFKPSGYAVYEQQHAIYNQFSKVRYFIDQKKFHEMQRFELRPGDLIMSCSGTMGKAAIAPEGIARGVINQALLKLRPKKRLAIEFLKLWMDSPNFEAALTALASGVAIKNVASVKILKEIRIALPPLSEQKHIVAVVDEAFAGLAAATANAEKNLRNARELFDCCLNSIFQGSGDLVALSTLASEITDGDHMPPPKAERGVPFITISNINKDTLKIDFSDTFKVSETYYTNLKDNRKPKHGDVLYTVTGSFGIPVLVNSDEKFCFQRHIGLVRPKPDVDSKWLYYALRSKFAFDQAASGATGTAQKTVSLKLLRSIKLPPMSASAQKVATTKLDNVYEVSQQLEAIYRRKIGRAAELKQSILQKAFSGELTRTPTRAIDEAAE